MIPALTRDLNLALIVAALSLPLLSFGVISVFTRPHPRLSAVISVGAVTSALTAVLWLVAMNRHMDQPIAYAGRWFISGKAIVSFGFLLDPTSLLMLTLVALISCLVQIYSLGYMAGDPGFSRYYAFQSLFAWAMMSLSVSSSLLQLYVFWELVGLSSYLLIGFWYEKFSASQAGKKAFVMTRLGDTAFLIGLFLVLISLGDLNILALDGAGAAARMSPFMITVSALLIFGGIIGKSAQFPLMTWLPDAMEGPTPVSALLHSATMVAAGVYLFLRLFPFFSHSESAMTVFLSISTVSMLMASTMAMVQRDIKQVLAYSTISQLGFMIMALSAGSYFAGAFHLTTHAAFKALLFLCAGFWIHHYGTNDLFEIGRRGGRGFRVPMVCLIVGAGALSGLPPLSGFFSKEAIMAALAQLHNPVWLAAGLAGAFLTAYYTFRLVFIILFPRETESEPHPVVAGHKRTLDRLMHWPLIVLSGITLALGFFEEPLKAFLLTRQGVHGIGAAEHSGVFYGSMALVFTGVAVAWFEFGRKRSPRVGFVERVPFLKALFSNRWYLDHFYRKIVKSVLDGTFSRLSAENERLAINGSLDLFARFTVAAGRVLSFLQSGILRYNLMVLFAVVTVLILFFWIG
jgi:NADH-quinone oxidoreductase subunit L